MLQEIIVYSIGIAVGIMIAYKIFKSLFSKDKHAESGCGHCSCNQSTKLTYKRVLPEKKA